MIYFPSQVQSYLKSQLLSQLTSKYSNDDLTTDEISTAFNFMFMTVSILNYYNQYANIVLTNHIGLFKRKPFKKNMHKQWAFLGKMFDFEFVIVFM